MHMNAEIGYLTQTSQYVFEIISSLSGGSKGGGGSNTNLIITSYLDNPDFYVFSMVDLNEKVTDKTP